MKKIFKIFILAAFILLSILIVNAQNSAFTFQGKLADAGAAANGQYDLRFFLFDAASGGTLFGAIVKDDVVVTQGIFTVTLDYGADVFTGNAGRYLEIGVRPGASTGAFTTISPRQELTAAPYSIESVRAEKAGTADKFAGLPPTSFLRSDTSQTFSGGNLTIGAASLLNVQGALLADGANVTNLNASNITTGTLDDNRLSPNAVLRNRAATFSSIISFDLPPFASGSNITNLRADNISSGTMNDARLSSNIPKLNTGNTFTGVNNNFTGRISANTLSVGGGLPLTKILTGSATLDFGNGEFLIQQVLNISVPGARVGDVVLLGIPASIMPQAIFGTPPVTVVGTEPYIFQGFVSAVDTVSVTFIPNLFPLGDGGGPVFPRTACLNSTGNEYYCADPPPGIFRVVVFSFAP